ncbi:polysaccharide biosynthesis protein [Candidatus Pristimantibacillus sp. PTI5]|uniref:polysaccharide biosynthesis protein n=1 Tax=Candidatus Pristimantibacillus sp. PTI5 TaxID=3400422 RepID=UPI003B010AEF
MFNSRTILITGGTGSWGQELTRVLLSYNPREIRIFSRSEFSQVQMQRDFNNHPSIKFIIGDVRDYDAVLNACKGVDYVYHLAALKHVPICELQPDEALKTNVLGTENVIRASIQQDVKKVMDVSTDKAVDAANFYGLTKVYGERLMIRANELSETTQFVCIRGGNVLGTRGSVVPFFKQLILENKEIPLTSTEMTRFFLTITEAITLLIKASHDAVGGEIFVMKMKACRILDLTNVLCKNITKNSIQIVEKGIRPGEKLHEDLISRYETERTYYYGEDYYVILPSTPSTALSNKYNQLPKVSFSSYSSDSSLLSEAEIEEMLKSGGFC